jgi:hypothetical protein
MDALFENNIKECGQSFIKSDYTAVPFKLIAAHLKGVCIT